MRTAKETTQKRPSYLGLKWDKTINSLNSPNFWKFGVADLIFLDYVGDRKLVLDVGCGTGGSTLFLASKGKAEWIVGVDLLRDMVGMAKKIAFEKKLSDKVCFIVCDGRHLPFKSSSFDGLISRGDAFCFLVPLRSTVHEFRRVIKPGGAVALEVDNRVDWKPGTTISTGFLKTNQGETAYLVTTFTKRRNYSSVSYILDPNGRIAKKIACNPEFQKKSFKPSTYPLPKIKKETIETRHATPTHWPTNKSLAHLFKLGGFTEVQVIGDGLLMNLASSREPAIVEALKNNPQLFFEIEKRLVRYVNPELAPTMILRATAS